ncbi:NUDIX domain-containing protein [Leptolyngbya sp. FACHB-711]|uniref:bis(5'-nucleosyl)-tetraphosphatase n=1 Tax=unclassified Leptolyngbya TaxID=2650499 RepID=UPI001687EE95|nr:NUDIX domain-containing protein [Leptolyngbya sp. FACHB-711]MBD1853495.1 NUDIX domain-containing protein [Cyanobacteria bacterium FACHB-502]MBD2026374.1 NUDIX domain-containing protein [Leptolyngbya sp. FACHB-711]
MSNIPHTDAAFGIVPILPQPDGYQFLLIQHWGGHWGFPKGHAEAEETAIAAARREFEEETGISAYEVIESVSFVEQYRFFKDKQPVDKTVTYFPAWVKSTTVIRQQEEIQNYCWLPYEDALKQMSFKQGKQILQQVQQYLSQIDLSRRNSAKTGGI